MSMLRSLDSAVTGLRNHQVRMDIIGNNIANVNTVGYKASRVTFEESLSQLLQGSTRPPGESGGKNPVQVGLGMSVGSIDAMFTQGNLEATGQVTDLAIEGDSFFAVSNGQGDFYTRNGAFQLDADGRMVLPTNGFVLQGKLADVDGDFPPGTVVEDISIPLAEQSPAQATEKVTFGKNLDADSAAKGSVHYSQRFLHHTQASDNLSALSTSKGNPLNIKAGDTLTFSSVDSGGVPHTTAWAVTQNATVQNLMDEIQTFLRTNANAGPGTTVALDPTSLGAITIFGSTTAISNFQVTSDNPQYGGEVTKAFAALGSTIGAGITVPPSLTDFFRSPAERTDLLAEVYNAEGNIMGLQLGDTISINGEIGGEAVTNTIPIVYNPATTVMSELITSLKDAFKLPERDLANSNNFSVEMNQGGSDDNIPDGSLVVRGIPGEGFALDSISIRAQEGTAGTKPSPLDFNSNMTMTRSQEARDAQVFDTSITAFDESGAGHVLTVTFAPTLEPGIWRWRANLAGDEIPLSGQQGDLIFDQDGSVSSFTFDDNSTEFAFDPNNGSDNVRVKLDVGGPGNFRGLTQFRAPTTATMTGQDGYTTGSLKEISIGEDGVINGIFSNGVNKALAQVMLVDFINPGGLLKISDSVYGISANSGDAVYVTAGSQQSSSIKPGALEISNVELAAQFTDMITTQRGYQANARAITVSDSLLDELVNLKR